jgi:hypothetical protein
VIRPAGITSNTVPWEILRAAGYAPRLLETEPGPTPFAGRYMEDVFDRRIRIIFDRLCTGSWKDLDLVVIPRTSEPEHKLYLYLREVARTHGAGRMPKLYLYNLLHTQSLESYSYGLERTRQMAGDLGATESALYEAITESNRARAAVRQIHQKRRDGLLEGSAALELTHRFYTEDRAAFADRVALELNARNVPVAGNRPRILIKGVLLDDIALHQVAEEAGGYVIAEDDWGGARAAGDLDVCTNTDPLTAIFDKYFYDEMSPRVHPAAARDAWFERQIEAGEVDGVLFYIPPEDDVIGWDYPRHRAFLEARGVPSLVVQERVASARITAFMAGIRRG